MPKKLTIIGKSIGFLMIAPIFIMPAIADRGHCGESMGFIEDVRQIEKQTISCNTLSGDYVGYVKGRIPVLISAPHGAKHYRTVENRWKDEDAYTSSVAIKLGQMTGAHVLYVKNKTAEDPNNDIGSRYKDYLTKVVKEKGIRFVIDLHGAGRDQPFKIDVGTIDNRIERSSCPTFKPLIEEAFHDFDGDIFNKRFQAKGHGTITYFSRNDLGIEAAQFEINAVYRHLSGNGDPAKISKEQDLRDLMGRLQTLILSVNDKIQSFHTIGSGGPASSCPDEDRNIRTPQSTRPKI
jgi:hypothetical protein